MSVDRADPTRPSVFVWTFLFLSSYLITNFTCSIPILFILKTDFLFSAISCYLAWRPQSQKIVTSTAASNPVNTMRGFGMYQICRKSCLWLLAESGNDRNATAKEILTWMGRIEDEKAKNSDKLSSFTSFMRCWVRSESDLKNVNLDAVFKCFQEHGQ